MLLTLASLKASGSSSGRVPLWSCPYPSPPSAQNPPHRLRVVRALEIASVIALGATDCNRSLDLDFDVEPPRIVDHGRTVESDRHPCDLRSDLDDDRDLVLDVYREGQRYCHPSCR